MASSSSGLGRRPLKAEIAGSNPVEATKEFSLHKCAGFFVFAAQMKAFCLQAGFYSFMQDFCRASWLFTL